MTAQLKTSKQQRSQSLDAQALRPAFTLIELTMVSVLLAIAAAVVVPKWNHSLVRIKVEGMQHAVESDIAYLCRTSVQKAKSTVVTLNTGTGTLQISPAMPGVLGNSSGLVNYSDRFPGVVISQADFDGVQKFRTNIFGELVKASDSKRLSVGRVTFSSGSTTRISDVLLAQGTLP